MQYQAYWVSPRNRLIPVPCRHINVIDEDPGLFGLARRYVDGQFRKARECNGTEGKARNVIMARVLRSGWIRLRYVPAEYSLTVQVADLRDPRLRDRAVRAGRRVRDGQRFPRDISLRLIDLGGKVVERIEPASWRRG